MEEVLKEIKTAKELAQQEIEEILVKYNVYLDIEFSSTIKTGLNKQIVIQNKEIKEITNN